MRSIVLALMLLGGSACTELCGEGTESVTTEAWVGEKPRGTAIAGVPGTIAIAWAGDGASKAVAPSFAWLRDGAPPVITSDNPLDRIVAVALAPDGSGLAITQRPSAHARTISTAGALGAPQPLTGMAADRVMYDGAAYLAVGHRDPAEPHDGSGDGYAVMLARFSTAGVLLAPPRAIGAHGKNCLSPIVMAIDGTTTWVAWMRANSDDDRAVVTVRIVGGEVIDPEPIVVVRDRTLQCSHHAGLDVAVFDGTPMFLTTRYDPEDGTKQDIVPLGSDAISLDTVGSQLVTTPTGVGVVGANRIVVLSADGELASTLSFIGDNPVMSSDATRIHVVATKARRHGDTETAALELTTIEHTQSVPLRLAESMLERVEYSQCLPADSGR